MQEYNIDYFAKKKKRPRQAQATARSVRRRQRNNGPRIKPILNEHLTGEQMEQAAVISAIVDSNLLQANSSSLENNNAASTSSQPDQEAILAKIRQELEAEEQDDQNEELEAEAKRIIKLEVDEEAPFQSPVKTFKNQFKGHYSRQTIKGVDFFGPKSEYVISGSDDGIIYIWERKTAKLVRILKGHDSTVNTVVGHPTAPVICSGGIDSYAKVWSPIKDFPSVEEQEKRAKEMNNVTEDNDSQPVGGREEESREDMMDMMQMFRQIIAQQRRRGAQQQQSDESDSSQ